MKPLNNKPKSGLDPDLLKLFKLFLEAVRKELEGA
jgi:hypothetical protein